MESARNSLESEHKLGKRTQRFRKRTQTQGNHTQRFKKRTQNREIARNKSENHLQRI